MKNAILIIMTFGVTFIGNSQIIDNGTLSLSHNSSVIGDMISLYGNRLGQTTMYGFGVSDATLYSKSNQKHFWYIGANHDNGTSAIMELYASKLVVKPKIESNSTISLVNNASATGDVISLYGNRLGQTIMYGFGVSDGALYSKSAIKHLWYIGANQDNGTSAIMELAGTTLTVDGKIKSEEVKVEIINGPDYVFQEGYELLTLEEIQDYINHNRHLPEIPSANMMETHGIDLGDMNMRLLKKIEELTLYTINQEKRINTLEKENKTLKIQEERIGQLEEKIAMLLNTKQ